MTANNPGDGKQLKLMKLLIDLIWFDFYYVFLPKEALEVVYKEYKNTITERITNIYEKTF